MNDSVHNEDLLIRYIDGELSASEKAEVESRLKTDLALQEEYNRLKVALQAIRHLGTTHQVESIHREMMQEIKGKPTSAKVFSLSKTVRYSMAVAASAIILFIGVRLFLGAQVSADSLYKETFVDFNVANTRGTDNNLSTIETLYQKKDFAAIASSARTINLSSKDSLLIGLSCLHTENLPAAITWFHALSATQNEYRQDAEFYLSLSYIKTKNYSKALDYLEPIYTNPAHIYHQQVTADVVEKLKKLAGK